MQADILELGELDMRFDLVAASGVLHFMDEPGKALEVLVGLVKPGGVLKTGIYSKIARRKHVELHRYVSEKGYQLTIEGLHAFRNDVFETGQDSPVTSDLPGHFDFYSTSMCRDLVFHVHEHAYNLIEIKAMLDRADLYLLRMEMSNPANKSSYRQMFPGDPDLRNIENLHQFEMSNQDAFIEMYNLWLCRKDEADSCDYSWVSMIGA
jgi:SAM-dependent methyltransferase